MHIPFGFAQVNLVFRGDGLPRDAEVTFGVDNNGSDLDADAIAGVVEGAYTSHVQAHASAHVAVVEYRVKKGPNNTGPYFSLAANDVGAGALGDMQPSVALLVRKNTDTGGRKGRGRMYWPILGETAIDNGGVITSTALATYQTAMSAFKADLATGLVPIVLLHGDALTVPTPVTALTVQLLTATQRRRLRK